MRCRIEILEKQVQGLKALEKQVQQLKRELATRTRRPRRGATASRRAVAEANRRAAQARKQAAAAQKQAARAEKKAAAAQQMVAAAQKKASEEENSSIKLSLHGAVTAGFTGTDAKGQHSAFGGGQFLPIILAKYKDWLLLESHLEFSTNTEGETDTELEYAQLDAMATDWLTIVAGKFLTPIAQFQQALHPPWINKLPDRPPGFVEDDGDEPLNETGIMARGGVPLGSMQATYTHLINC